jgi:DNA-binding NtrC family response regulator
MKMIKEEKFREDLYYRLNVISILIPGLCERCEDVPLLIRHFLKKENERTDKNINFSIRSIEVMQKYPWPGNVRELENFIKMICVTTEKQTVEPEDLPESIFSEAIINSIKWKNLWQLDNFQTAIGMVVENFEKEFLRYHIAKNNSNISRTAEAIGLSRVSLYKKINQYSLDV